MLERAQFCLSRAAVMAGMCSLVFLSAGLIPHSLRKSDISSTYTNERNFERAQTILRHISPVSLPISIVAMKTPQRCEFNTSGKESWERMLSILENQLQQLHQEQFLKQAYALNLDNLFSDPQAVDVPCEQLSAGIRWLTRQSQNQGQSFWYGLTWRERSPQASTDRLQGNAWVALPKSMVTSRSPWAGLSGCMYWTEATSGKPLYLGPSLNPETTFCLQQAKLQNNGREPESLSMSIALPSLPLITQALSPWRQPQHPRHALVIQEPHVAQVRSEDIPVGLHTQLTIDPRWQNTLQNLVACYTHSSSLACNEVVTKGDTRYENARVRKAGLVVMDIPSGAVLAAVSSDSPCSLHDTQRKGLRPAGCPDVPEGSVYRPQWPKQVDNHALFAQAQPGSLVKPLLMAGILSSGGNYPGLDSALQRSDSQQFLDAWLCRANLRTGKFANACDRPVRTQAIARAWGWNLDCDESSTTSMSTHCGQRNILTGLALDQPSGEHPSLPILSGHTLLSVQHMPSADDRLKCANTGKTGYTRCKGANLGLISEGYGQGNTLTSPVGMAGLLASLANTAYASPLTRPHVLAKVFRNDSVSSWLFTDPANQTDSSSKSGVKPEIAKKIITAMELTHRKTGTAFSACSGVWGTQTCQSDLGIAGKTGTPGDADERSLKQLYQDSLDRQACLSRRDFACEARYPLPRPRYRWYGALFKQTGSEKFDKVVVVLIQSNWRKSDGQFADDQNAAAEIGFRAIKLLRQGATP